MGLRTNSTQKKTNIDITITTNPTAIKSYEKITLQNNNNFHFIYIHGLRIVAKLTGRKFHTLA